MVARAISVAQEACSRLKFPGVAIFNYVTGALLFAAFVMLASSYEHYKERSLSTPLHVISASCLVGCGASEIFFNV